MFKGLMGSLGGSGQGGAPGQGMPSDDQMQEMLKQFTSMLSEGEGNNEFQGAMESIVKDIISKDSMYEPMRKLKDAYPEWLEANWQKLEDQDLERYNKQLDKVTEICAAFEIEVPSDQQDANKEKIFELLNQLQELGHPPTELMSKIHNL